MTNELNQGTHGTHEDTIGEAETARMVAAMTEDLDERAEYLMEIDDERMRLKAEVEDLRKERDSLRKTNTRLHRRCQQAESALPAWQEIQTSGFKGGSFGRALTVWGLARAQEDNERLLKALDEAADWFNGWLGWLDAQGEAPPEGATELYEKLGTLIQDAETNHD